MPSPSCPVCVERCHRLRVEYLKAKGDGNHSKAKRLAVQAKRSGCRWAKRRVGKP